MRLRVQQYSNMPEQSRGWNNLPYIFEAELFTTRNQESIEKEYQGHVANPDSRRKMANKMVRVYKPLGNSRVQERSWLSHLFLPL